MKKNINFFCITKIDIEY